VTIDGQGRKAIEIPTIYHPTGDVIAQLDGVGWFLVPDTLDGWDIIGGAGHVTTPSTSGAPTMQIRRNRRASTTSRTDADVFSTKIVVDVNEYSSVDATASVVNTSNDDLATGDVLFVDSDVATTGGKGLVAVLLVQPRLLSAIGV
jgi:hypothetical protein